VEILFLSHRIPFPPNKGDKIRSLAMITHLAKQHRVHLACFVDDPNDMAYVDHVRHIVGGECLFVPLKPVMKWARAASALITGKPITTAYFGSRTMRRWVNELVKRHPIDRAIVYSTAMAPYILDESGFNPARVIFDMQDMDSDKWRQYASSSNLAKLLGLERLAAAQFGVTTLVSPYEAASFAAIAPESASRIHSLTHGVDLRRYKVDDFASPFSSSEVPLVMTGRMDYRPNYEGAAWFANKVMPHVLRQLPQARFHIVGANPVSQLRALAGPQIVLTGQVDDVRPYVRHAAVAVAPLQMARGIQNKVLEAMAMEKPVVATPQATRALAVTSGVELWIESEPSKFAAAVVAATSSEYSDVVSQNARKYVELNHDWAKNLVALDEFLAEFDRRRGERGVSTSGEATTTAPQQTERLPKATKPSLVGAER
jgi:sugar transferase (PEP-CTERM/EpsH1 system associated)